MSTRAVSGFRGSGFCVRIRKHFGYLVRAGEPGGPWNPKLRNQHLEPFSGERSYPTDQAGRHSADQRAGATTEADRKPSSESETWCRSYCARLASGAFSWSFQASPVSRPGTPGGFGNRRLHQHGRRSEWAFKHEASSHPRGSISQCRDLPNPGF